MNTYDMVKHPHFPAFVARLRALVAVDSDDSCWLWQGGRARNGYGITSFKDRIVGAHRAMWVAVNGAIPEGLWVLHKCDNPPCCNPAHLFLGTAQDNFDDMVAKGRARALTSRVGSVVVTPEMTRAIGLDTRPNGVIARDYGISEVMVSRARHRWRKKIGK